MRWGSGLAQSFTAWNKRRDAKLDKYGNFLLPGLDFTREQLFFIGSCQDHSDISAVLTRSSVCAGLASQHEDGRGDPSTPHRPALAYSVPRAGRAVQQSRVCQGVQLQGWGSNVPHRQVQNLVRSLSLYFVPRCWKRSHSFYLSALVDSLLRRREPLRPGRASLSENNDYLGSGISEFGMVPRLLRFVPTRRARSRDDRVQ